MIYTVARKLGGDIEKGSEEDESNDENDETDEDNE